jgi:hypothetical protein
MTDSRSSIHDPLRQSGDRCLGHLGVIDEAELLKALAQREARIDQASSFSAFGSL